ncbi:YfcC family protein [Cytobacillus oceanisediminis]|uniref:YfcC family protein n=1 Tax=Cytobacillus oceanisediminis TaxID=665099 RepID=UPI003734E3BE
MYRCALVLVSTVAGFATAVTAPATLGIAQQITELPLYSGALYRVTIFATMTTIGIAYVWRYARKIQRNPEFSYVYGDGKDQSFIDRETEDSSEKSSKRQKLAFIVLGLGIIVMLYGLFVWKWYFIELGGWYAFLGIAIGLICGMTPSRIAEVFHDGFKMMLLGVLLIGIARSISIILESGNILDTIVFGISRLVGSLPGELAAVGMLGVQGLFNFLVGSGSGQAMIMMPIMTGISDLLGVTRQTAVLAFQFGDGFTNVLYPTAGPFMATLALAHVGYSKWLKFILPLMGIWIVLCIVFLVTAQLISWGAGLQ